MRILFIDHDDSFSNNVINVFLARNFQVELISHNLLKKMNPLGLRHDCQMVIFSPGPGSPSEYPHSIEFYHSLPDDLPVLGICLGHQLMLHACGGNIQQIAQNPVHGRQVTLDSVIISPLLGRIKFTGTIVLYHSLGFFKSDPVFKTWYTHIIQNDLCLMAEHHYKPHIGVQFHPESFASTAGKGFFNKVIRLLRQ